jgi:hypothetical protein
MPSRSVVTLIALIIFVFGVRQSIGQNTDRARYVPSSDEIAQYFRGELSADANGALAYYGARDLHIMEEKPLFANDPKVSEVYRVLVETRPHNAPVLVRLSIGTDGTGEVVIKMGSDPYHGDLGFSKNTDVSRADVDEFLKRLENSGVWSTPVEQPLDIRHAVLGPASWMFEGSRGSTYHVVCRNTPGLASLRDAELFLLTQIGGVDLTGKL